MRPKPIFLSRLQRKDDAGQRDRLTLVGESFTSDAHLTHNATRTNVPVMPVTIPSAALAHMSDAERARLVDAAFVWSEKTLTNYLAVLDARLAIFEQRYELLTSELGEAVQSGRLRETAEVSEWLFWAHIRTDLARKARP